MGILGLEDPLEHVRYRCANTPLNAYPYRHLYTTDVFPEWYYEQLLEHFPPAEVFTPLNDRDRRRLKVDLAGEDDVARLDEPYREFWSEFKELFINHAFMNAMLDKYCGQAAERFRDRCWPMVYLFRDTSSWGIGPHPDTRVKLITLLFYLPDDASHRRYGTSVLVPRQSGTRPDPGPHNRLDGWDQFKTVFTAPYVPNSMMSFYVTDDSWHGVDAPDEPFERKSIQYFVCVGDHDPR